MPPHMGSYLVDQLICIYIFNCGDHPCGAVDIFFSDFKLYCQKKIGQIFRNIRAMNIKMEGTSCKKRRKVFQATLKTFSLLLLATELQRRPRWWWWSFLLFSFSIFLFLSLFRSARTSYRTFGSRPPVPPALKIQITSTVL